MVMGTLVPRREQTVDFYGDAIPVAATEEGEPYVALRPITDHLGLDARSQRRRVQADRVIAPRLRTLALSGSDGRRRDFLCLPLDLLPGFLFGIDAARARPELVEKLDRYRADCFRILWEAFRGEAWSVGPAIVPEPVPVAEPGLSGAALALEIATAVQHLAREQLALEQRLADVAGKQSVMADYLRGFIRDTDRRLRTLEHRERTATIAEEQAAELAVGEALRQRGDPTGYQTLYAMIYREYAISTYHNLPAAAYPRVMGWLHDWYVRLTDEQGRALVPETDITMPRFPR
jgi:hypothetical protein